MEFDELDDISRCSLSASISERLFVSVKFLHWFEIVTVPNSNDNYAHWVGTQLNYKILGVCFIVEFTVR